MVALLRLTWILSLAAAPFLATAVPAGATASLTCAAGDRNLSFELLGSLGSGDGGAIQLIEGKITLKPVRGKLDAREFKVAPEHISGQWSFEKELRIGISPESVDEVSVFLAIIASERTAAIAVSAAIGANCSQGAGTEGRESAQGLVEGLLRGLEAIRGSGY